ncbi:MAG: alpha/beta hydrolase [Candidatus Zixiibacteriota bacterium]
MIANQGRRWGRLAVAFLLPIFVSVESAMADAGSDSAMAMQAKLKSAVGEVWQQTEPIRARTFIESAALAEEEFTRRWDAVFEPLLDTLDWFEADAFTPRRDCQVERTRVLCSWGKGRLIYPFMRWRETGQSVLELSESYDEYLGKIDRKDALLLDVDEYRSFLRLYVHEMARRRLLTDSLYRTGDNRWTRAEYDVCVDSIPDTTLNREILYEILSEHIEKYGTKCLAPLISRFKQAYGEYWQSGKLDSLYTDERRYWEGFTSEVYKRADGIDLELHMLESDSAVTGIRPALVWFHGGSWSEGVWYWGMGLTGALASAGMKVFQVEYRIHDRHLSTPVQSLEDAKSAIRYVRANASRLGIDPNRIMAAGFSAGGTLAVSTALLDGFEGPGEDTSISSRPTAVVSVSGCLDPTLDPWFRRIVQPVAPEDLSPLAQVRGGAPPMVLINGTRDEMCAFGAASEFSERMAAAGNVCELAPLEGRSHFFPVMNRADRTDALTTIGKFLANQGVLESGD